MNNVQQTKTCTGCTHERKTSALQRDMKAVHGLIKIVSFTIPKPQHTANKQLQY